MMTPDQSAAYDTAWRLKLAVEMLMADLMQGETALATAQLQSIGRWDAQLRRKMKGLQ